MQRANLRVIKALIALFPALILLSLLFDYLSIDSQKVIRADWRSPSPYISRLYPPSRTQTAAEEDFHQRSVVGEPLYFDVKHPNRFKRVKLQLTYRTNLSLVSVGLALDNARQRVMLKNLQNTKLEDLMKSEGVLKTQNDFYLWQKEKKYLSVQDFLDNPPFDRKIAQFFVDLDYNYRIEDYTEQAEEKVWDVSLAGPHQFYTYVGNGSLDMQLNFRDEVRSGQINIYDYQDNLMQSLDDLAQEQKLRIDNLPEGVYKVELKFTQDTVLEKIQGRQSKLAFINTLNLQSDNALRVYAKSDKLSFQTADVQGIQKIIIDRAQELDLQTRYEQVNASSLDKNIVHEIQLEKAMLKVDSDGLFSFASEEMLDPRLVTLNSAEDFNEQDYDYIIAKLNEINSKSQLVVRETEFSVPAEAYHDNKLTLTLSLPGIEREGAYFILENAELTFTQQSMRETLKALIKRRFMYFKELINI